MHEVRKPAIAYGKQKLSIEKYLQFEKASVEKLEYYRGEIFAMPGASNKHVKIYSILKHSGLIKKDSGNFMNTNQSMINWHFPQFQ